MSKIKFETKRCKGCGLCVLFCPKKNLRMSADLNDQGHPYPEEIDPENCTGCGLCFRMCPDTAIQVNKNEAEPVPQTQGDNDKESPE